MFPSPPVPTEKIRSPGRALWVGGSVGLTEFSSLFFVYLPPTVQTGYNGTNGDKIVFPASAQDFTEMGSNTCGTWQM